MKIKIMIKGKKVHEVGYRYFLLSIAMSQGIRRFEAHNIRGKEEAVKVLVDGEDSVIEDFNSAVKSYRPAQAEVSSVDVEQFDGDVMSIGEYAQFCSTVQLNKAIPVLLEIRDNTRSNPQILAEIKEMREDIQPGYAMQFRQMQSDIRMIKAQLGLH